MGGTGSHADGFGALWGQILQVKMADWPGWVMENEGHLQALVPSGIWDKAPQVQPPLAGC